MSVELYNVSIILIYGARDCRSKSNGNFLCFLDIHGPSIGVLKQPTGNSPLPDIAPKSLIWETTKKFSTQISDGAIENQITEMRHNQPPEFTNDIRTSPLSITNQPKRLRADQLKTASLRKLTPEPGKYRKRIYTKSELVQLIPEKFKTEYFLKPEIVEIMRESCKTSNPGNYGNPTASPRNVTVILSIFALSIDSRYTTFYYPGFLFLIYATFIS